MQLGRYSPKLTMPPGRLVFASPRMLPKPAMLHLSAVAMTPKAKASSSTRDIRKRARLQDQELLRRKLARQLRLVVAGPSITIPFRAARSCRAPTAETVQQGVPT